MKCERVILVVIILIGMVLVMEDDRTTVSLEGIKNSDQVIVSGEFKMVGVDRLNEFAASKN